MKKISFLLPVAVLAAFTGCGTTSQQTRFLQLVHRFDCAQYFERRALLFRRMAQRADVIVEKRPVAGSKI